MTRLEKELTRRGIIYQPNDFLTGMGAEYDVLAELVTIDKDFLITAVYSATVDTELCVYDRKTLQPIGRQQLFPEYTFGNSRTWLSWAYTNI